MLKQNPLKKYFAKYRETHPGAEKFSKYLAIITPSWQVSGLGPETCPAPSLT
jgi:hypothetical protein